MLYPRLPVEDAGDDLGDGGVAGDVAGCAEAVHGYVEGDHEGVVGLGETEHRCEEAKGGHDGSTGDAGGGDDGDAEHGDEAHEHRCGVRNGVCHHQGEGAGYDLKCGS